jgi:hypothetical protein
LAERAATGTCGKLEEAMYHVRIPPRFFRRLVLLGTPLALAGVELTHPTGFTADVFAAILPRAEAWVLLHFTQLVLFAFLAMGLFFMVEGQSGFFASLARMGAGIFAVFYSAHDAISGLGVGTFTVNARGLPPEQQAVIGQAIQKMYFDPVVGGQFSILLVLGTVGWLTAILAGAGALYRVGAPTASVVLLPAAAVLFGISHAPPWGPLGMFCLFLANGVLEWHRRKLEPVLLVAGAKGPAIPVAPLVTAEAAEGTQSGSETKLS